MSKCNDIGCEKRAAFGIKGGKAQYCKSHKTAIMIDLIHRCCEYEGCSCRPNFDIEGGKGRFCKIHKELNMVDVKNKRCASDSCSSRPIFDIEGGKGSYCKTHKTNEMIDVVNRRCHIKGCKLQPCYDVKGGKGSYCKTHKTGDMIDVIHRKCESIGCDIIPVFDFKGGKGRFCKIHKELGMVDVKSRLCEVDKCDKQSHFDVVGGKGRFCKIHKELGMVDVKNVKCEKDGCNKHPLYNIKGKKGRFCLTHKTADMINVTHPTCVIDNCNTRPSYGLPGHSPTCCSTHRQPGMILKPTARCSDCKESALWGINWTPRHCELHKTSDDENLVERPCASCNLPFILDKDNKCEYCNPASFTITRLAKQNALMEYLDSRNLKGDLTDKTIDSGICGKERPDRIYDLGDKILVLECDENQHQERACLCEQTRMINIGQSFGGVPVYFLRWNPDNYITVGHKKMDDIKKRYKLVADLIVDIKTGRTTLPNALVSVIYLYYDNWSSLAEEEWKIMSTYVKNEIIYPTGEYDFR